MVQEIDLTTGELISFFRNRKGFTQAELGKIVFDDLQTPNVKIKKIEKNQQQPTEEDIKKIAEALGVTPEILKYGKITMPLIHDNTANAKEREGEYSITKKIKTVCPNFETYLQAINSMAKINDMDLMLRILKKMCTEILDTSDSQNDCKGQACMSKS
jgi:transcriptional regulator with XRE-family HTH domain